MRHSATVPWLHCAINESSSRRSADKSASFRLHLRQMFAGEGVHGCARLLFLVGKLEQGPNLLDGKAEVAGAPGEDKTADVRA